MLVTLFIKHFASVVNLVAVWNTVDLTVCTVHMVLLFSPADTVLGLPSVRRIVMTLPGVLILEVVTLIVRLLGLSLSRCTPFGHVVTHHVATSRLTNVVDCPHYAFICVYELFIFVLGYAFGN